MERGLASSSPRSGNLFSFLSKSPLSARRVFAMMDSVPKNNSREVVPGLVLDLVPVLARVKKRDSGNSGKYITIPRLGQ